MLAWVRVWQFWTACACAAITLYITGDHPLWLEVVAGALTYIIYSLGEAAGKAKT